MNLLQIIPTYKPAKVYGGTMTSVCLLCETLASKGNCQVTVASTTANGKYELPVYKKTPKLVDGVSVFYFPRWTKDHSQFSPALLWWLWRNVRKYDAVHIHSWWNISVLLSTSVCILRGVKPVLAPRGMLSPFTITGRFKPIFHRFIGEKLLKKTFLHATSEQERRECLSLIPDWQNTNLPNLLDIPSNKTQNNSTVETSHIRLLFLSRIHQKKGLELLFEALADVPFSWSLSIGGDGETEYIEQLKNQTKTLNIDDKIHWLGWVDVDNRGAVFQAADLFVLPSHNENFANVVVESLAAGTPVLVSQYVGLSDYVLTKNMGWVCDTTLQSLREKLTEATTQNTKRHQIARYCGEQVRQDFDPSVLVKRYIDMYQKIEK